MGRRFVLERRQLVNASLPEVFRFFEDPRNLEELTPPFLNFQIQTPDVEMAVGARIVYRLALYGLPLRWRTRIDEYVGGERFVDFQESGPYRYWHHLHTFRAVPGGTEVGDRVTYELPFGVLGQLVHWLWVKRQLNLIFDYRSASLLRRFGG
jgi:ligand-binding SRPBCC domain-containing protein